MNKPILRDPFENPILASMPPAIARRDMPFAETPLVKPGAAGKGKGRNLRARLPLVVSHGWFMQ